MKRQIAFIFFIFVLMMVILGLGIYSNGMKRVRKLDKTVQATWGDVEWRLEERNQLLPAFIKTVKSEASSEKKLLKTIMKQKEELDEAIKKGNRLKVIEISNRLDQSLSQALEVIDSIPELKQNENYLNERKQLFDVEDRITSDKRQYNEAVYRFNDALHSLLGRLIAYHYSPQVLFQSIRNTDQESS